MPEIITSTKNKKYKFIKSLQQKKARQSEGLFSVEGIKSVRDAANSNAHIQLIAMSESFYGSADADIAQNIPTLIVTDDIFSGLCDTKTPQGIIAVIKITADKQFTPDLSKLYIFCDNVSDPGNLGTIIRTADAAGFGGVLLSKGCADLYSPKTVRSSMGSFFNIDIIPDFEYNDLISLKSKGFRLFCGALTDDSISYTQADFTEPSVIIVGNEANGASDVILQASEHIIIPIHGNAESLNVGVAASILMYEGVRQREEKSGDE